MGSADKKEDLRTITLHIFLLLIEKKMVKMLYHKNILGKGLMITYLASINLKQKYKERIRKKNEHQNGLKWGVNGFRNNFKKYNKLHRKIKIYNSVRS